MKALKIILSVLLIALLISMFIGCSAINAVSQIKALDGVLDAAVIKSDHIVSVEVILEPDAHIDEPETLANAAVRIAQKQFRNELIFLKLTQNKKTIGSYMN